MTEDKPMNILKVGIDTLPPAMKRIGELGAKERTETEELELKELIAAVSRLADNLKNIMDVIM
jgi:hypothetical protein